MSFSEITKVDFVDYKGEDSEFINHLDNIIQMPLGTEPDRLGGCDRDDLKIPFLIYLIPK